MIKRSKNFSAGSLCEALRKLSDGKREKISSGFFKTGKGEYGEGDIFIGVTVPDVRKVAGDFIGLSFSEIEKLLKSRVHEDRLAGLLVLVWRFNKFPEGRKKVFDFYYSHLESANNWDLVDLSADKIVGEWLAGKTNRAPIYKLLKSKNLWRRRAAMVSVYAFIKRGDLDDAFKIAEALLEDGHDLIRKAVGWMLREAGKVDGDRLECFIRTNLGRMSRVTLRYAIERFPEAKRKTLLSLR